MAATSSVERRSTGRLCVGLTCDRTARLVVESRRIASAGERWRRLRCSDCQRTRRCGRSARRLHCVAAVRSVQMRGAATPAVSHGAVGTRSSCCARAQTLLTRRCKRGAFAPAREQAPTADQGAPRQALLLQHLRQAREGRGKRRLLWRDLYRRMRRSPPSHVFCLHGSRGVGGGALAACVPRSRRRGAMHVAARVASNSPPASPSAAQLHSPPSSPSFAAARVRARCACSWPLATHHAACWALTRAAGAAAQQRGSNKPRSGAFCSGVSRQRSGGACCAGGAPRERGVHRHGALR